MIAGHVYRIRTTLVNPPKIKIVLCAGGGLFLWFNTEPRRRPAQLQAFPDDAPGLTRACYLDCGQVTVFSEEELAAAKHEGRASNAFLRRVIEEVELRAVTLSTAQRGIIAEALKGLPT